MTRQTTELSARDKKRIARVREKVDMGQQLAAYGYGIQPGSYQEQQFRCDLHGFDNKPSARYYPESNSTYCWACGVARDPITLVRDREGVGYFRALSMVEEEYNLPTMPWDDESGEEEVSEAETFQGELASIFANAHKETFGTLFHRVDGLLKMAREDGDLPMERFYVYADNLDRLRYLVRKAKTLNEETGMEGLRRIEKRLTDVITRRPAETA